MAIGGPWRPSNDKTIEGERKREREGARETRGGGRSEANGVRQRAGFYWFKEGATSLFRIGYFFCLIHSAIGNAIVNFILPIVSPTLI